jgi:predicted DNA-binding protein (MmcQ/YjbR family)
MGASSCFDIEELCIENALLLGDIKLLLRMNAEEIRNYCMAKKAVTESLPFDEHTLVFKVAGKMFLLLSLDSEPLSINVKCNPDKAIELRDKYNYVLPGYHMNKKHWNTVNCSTSASKKLIFGWIDDSYDLVVEALPKKLKDALIK